MNKYIALLGAVQATNIKSLAQCESSFVIDPVTDTMVSQSASSDIVHVAMAIGINKTN